MTDRAEKQITNTCQTRCWYCRALIFNRLGPPPHPPRCLLCLAFHLCGVCYCVRPLNARYLCSLWMKVSSLCSVSSGFKPWQTWNFRLVEFLGTRRSTGRPTLFSDVEKHRHILSVNSESLCLWESVGQSHLGLVRVWECLRCFQGPGTAVSGHIFMKVLVVIHVHIPLVQKTIVTHVSGIAVIFPIH